MIFRQAAELFNRKGISSTFRFSFRFTHSVGKHNRERGDQMFWMIGMIAAILIILGLLGLLTAEVINES